MPEMQRGGTKTLRDRGPRAAPFPRYATRSALTHTSLVVEALCGADIRFHGEPDVAVICVECLEVADSHGIDATAWSRETLVTVRLPLAA